MEVEEVLVRSRLSVRHRLFGASPDVPATKSDSSEILRRLFLWEQSPPLGYW